MKITRLMRRFTRAAAFLAVGQFAIIIVMARIAVS